MAREFKRADRVADAIQRNLAQLIQFEIRDPRVGMVNINDVTVTRDMAYAKVFITFVDLESDEEAEESAKALNNAAGYLRSQLAKLLDMRTTPRLQFLYDKTSVKGQQLSNLIDKAMEADRKNHPNESEPNDESGSN